MVIMAQENKLYVLIVILSIAVVILAAGLYVGNVRNITPEQRTISVSGSASTFVTPDTASISLGVVTEAATAKEASDNNAASMNAVISALKSLGLQDKDIRTSSLSLQPVYNYSREGVPAIVGYSASNNVDITTTMLDKLSDIVDKSIASGANQVNDISFVISDERQSQIRNELLGNATKDAEAQASKIAESLNVKITGVKTASISEVFPQPVVSAFAGKTGAPVTPVMPGESKVTLNIDVTYIIE